MKHQCRIQTIQEAPFSWKDKDILSAAEKYLVDLSEIPMIPMIMPCFPGVPEEIEESLEAVWQCLYVSWHLDGESESIETIKMVKTKAADLYQKEAQRILGSIFSKHHPFWRAFYTRQDESNFYMICALDALHHATSERHQECHQLLSQSIKYIVHSRREVLPQKKICLVEALKLLGDLPLPALRGWIRQEIYHSASISNHN